MKFIMSEAELNEKLKNFSFMVMEDAQKKRNDLVDRATQETQKRLDEKETEYLTQAYERIQSKLTKYRKRDNERVLQTEVQSKRALFLKREAIIQEVFDGVKEKINTFRNQPEYNPWLVKLTQKALDEVGEGKKTVFLVPEDMEVIKKAFADCNISVEDAGDIDFLGGVKVYNHDKRVAVDYSFKELLASKKTKFLQNSGLVIE